MLPAMYTDESGSDNDDYSNSDDEETEVYEQKVQEGIQNGVLVVKNPDDTYKCPLSPGKKKQSYKYRELLAHATTIASGKKGPEKVGGHRALMKYLQAELGDKPMIPQAERVLYLEQTVPKREVVTRLLAPWMGILVNIDNSRTNDKGFRVAAGAADIKEKFKVTGLPKSSMAVKPRIFRKECGVCSATYISGSAVCMDCLLSPPSYFPLSCLVGSAIMYFEWLYIPNSNFHLRFWLCGGSGV